MDKLHARTCDLLEPLFDLHYYDVIKSEYLLGDGSPVRIVNTETHKCDKHYMAHVVCLDKNAALFNVGSRVDMDGNILSHGRASEDLELLCKDMTNASVREGRLFGLEQMAEEERDNRVRMQCPCPSGVRGVESGGPVAVEGRIGVLHVVEHG